MMLILYCWRTPEIYCDQKLPSKVPPVCEPVPLTSLPTLGYLEQVWSHSSTSESYQFQYNATCSWIYNFNMWYHVHLSELNLHCRVWQWPSSRPWQLLGVLNQNIPSSICKDQHAFMWLSTSKVTHLLCQHKNSRKTFKPNKDDGKDIN